MPRISTIFWDVGGVLLSNAWDHTQREQAFEHFALKPQEFESRHEMVVSSFERGKITLDEYLDRTVFYHPRPFTRDAFREYMFSLSVARAETLAFARNLAASGKYLMATINNESTDLNLYRIRHFSLRDIFTYFVSSCIVGYRKPERDIYRLALELSQRPPDECCFIDDRALNLECAKNFGMHTIHMEGLPQLQQKLLDAGVGI